MAPPALVKGRSNKAQEMCCECLNSKPRHHVLSLIQASISCLNVYYWEKEVLLCQKLYSSILLKLGIISSHPPILKIWVFPISEWRTHPNLPHHATAPLPVPQRHVIRKQMPSHHQPASIPCFRCNHGKVTFSPAVKQNILGRCSTSVQKDNQAQRTEGTQQRKMFYPN